MRNRLFSTGKKKKKLRTFLNENNYCAVTNARWSKKISNVGNVFAAADIRNLKIKSISKTEKRTLVGANKNKQTTTKKKQYSANSPKRFREKLFITVYSNVSRERAWRASRKIRRDDKAWGAICRKTIRKPFIILNILHTVGKTIGRWIRTARFNVYVSAS